MQTLAAKNEGRREGGASVDNNGRNAQHTAKMAQNRPNLSIKTNVTFPKKKGWNYFFSSSSNNLNATTKSAPTSFSDRSVINPRTTSLAAVATTSAAKSSSSENSKSLAKRNNSLPIITAQQQQQQQQLTSASTNNVNALNQSTTYTTNVHISSSNIFSTHYNNQSSTSLATAPPRPSYNRQMSDNSFTPVTATILTPDTSSGLHTAETPSTASSHSKSSAIMKKFHFPFFFHKRQNSFASEDQREAFFRDLYTPPTPEPVIPSLYDCMSPTESPISPPPWELSEIERLNKRKHHSFGHQFEASMSPSLFSNTEEEDTQLQRQSRSVRNSYFSESDFDRLNDNSNSTCSSPAAGVAPVKASTSQDGSATELNRASSITLHDFADAPGSTNLRRRSSCPTYDAVSMTSSASSTTSSTRTLVDNDIVCLTEKHTREARFLKKTAATGTCSTSSNWASSSSSSIPMAKSSSSSSCCKKLATKLSRDNSTSSNDTNSVPSTDAHQHQLHHSSSSTSLCDSDQLKFLYIPTVFDPVTRSPVLQFATIKPRKYQLHRKISWKKEAKALMTWHHSLEDKLRHAPPPPSLPAHLPPEKLEKSLLTRRFILREFFTTEVNFWNQLYYSKLVFYDALVFSLQKEYTLLKEDDMDIFANLFDLMQFSAKLINHLRHFQARSHQQQPMNSPNSLKTDEEGSKPGQKEQARQQGDFAAFVEDCLDENNLYLGRSFLDMAEDLVVFLRCAIDYKANRKIHEKYRNNELVVKYRQVLMARKETRRFSMEDYLIIPIQRVARYGLLLTDLLKHTQKSHPDYDNLVKCLHIVTSLGYAMDSVQKKKMKT